MYISDKSAQKISVKGTASVFVAEFFVNTGVPGKHDYQGLKLLVTLFNSD